jgi:nitrogen fixation protein FixH
MKTGMGGNGSEQLTGRHVAVALISFFTVVIGVNFMLAWLASESWTGLVVPNSYVASQNYNLRLEAAREQKARGWREHIDYADDRLNLEIVDREGRPVLLDNVRVEIGRPATDFEDHEIALAYAGGGRYGALDRLDGGVWQMVVRGESKEGDYRIEGRMFVTGEGKGKLQ